MSIPSKSFSGSFSIPVFGIGTWRMGGNATMDPANNDAADIAAIRTAIEQGISHIDTAELYADGHAEELVAQAIRGYDRSKLFVASKALAMHLGKKELRNALETSLRRLNTDYLDLYMIHFPSDSIPIEETMEMMNLLADEGKIRYLGVSNFSKERMIAAQKASKRKISAIQAHYNLIYREPERSGLLEYCQTNDIVLIAWRPVEKGVLANPSFWQAKNERVASNATATFDSGVQNLKEVIRSDPGQARVTLIQDICVKYKKTPAQIAINWLISQKNVVTLSKMRTIGHIEENLGAVGWEMEKEDIERLRKEFPEQKDVSNAVPLR